MKHTPWKIEKREKQYFCSSTGARSFTCTYIDIVDSGGENVAYVYGSSQEVEAVARFISAAPEMFEALENALGAFNDRECNCDGEYVDGRLVGHTCYFHRIEQELLAAIAKAEGRK